MNNTENFTVLLVEDTQEMAQWIMRVVNYMGLQTHHAETGEDAIRFIEESKPDLALLDLHLPGLNGWEVLEYAEALYGERSIPIIVITSDDGDYSKRMGQYHAIDRYLTKPITPDQLMASITEVLGL